MSLPQCFRVGKPHYHYNYTRIGEETLWRCERGINEHAHERRLFVCKEQDHWVAIDAPKSLTRVRDVKTQGTPIFKSKDDDALKQGWHAWFARGSDQEMWFVTTHLPDTGAEAGE